MKVLFLKNEKKEKKKKKKWSKLRVLGLGLDGVDATWEVQDSSLVLSLILRGQDWRCSIRTAKIQLALRLRFWGIKLLSIMIYLGPWMSEFADKNICLYVIFKNLHLWLTFVCFYVIFLGNDLSCFFFFSSREHKFQKQTFKWNFKISAKPDILSLLLCPRDL